jgi:hypothetical protein
MNHANAALRNLITRETRRARRAACLVCRLLIASFAALGFLGCGHLERAQVDRAQIRSIGVVSLMGDQVSVQKVQPAILGGVERQTIPTSALGLHEITEKYVAASMRGVTVKNLGGQRSQIAAAVLDARGGVFVARPGGPDWARDEAIRLGKEAGIDALALIVPDKTLRSSTPGQLKGFTLLIAAPLWGESANAMALQRLYLYETKTGKRGGIEGASASVPLKDQSWRNPYSSQVRDAFAEAIRRNAEDLVRGAGFR